MDILIQDLRFAFRSLRRSPGFTVLVVGVLALGIGVNTMIFSMVYGIMFRPWPLPRFDRVMTVLETNQAQDVKGNSVSWLDFQDLRDPARSFSVVGGYWETGGQVVLAEEPAMTDAANITAELLPALGVTPQLGRNFTRDENVYGQNWGPVLVSDRIWRRRLGGTRDVLGRTLRLNGRVRTIVGVMPPDFRWPESVDFWIPAAVSPEDARARAGHDVDVVAGLASGVTRQQADAEVKAIYARLVKQNPVALKGKRAGERIRGRVPQGHRPHDADHVVRGRLRSAHRVRERRQPHARAARGAQARDERAPGTRGLPRPRRAPAPHGKPAPVARRRGGRPLARGPGKPAVDRAHPDGDRAAVLAQVPDRSPGAGVHRDLVDAVRGAVRPDPGHARVRHEAVRSHPRRQRPGRHGAGARARPERAGRGRGG